MDKAKKIAICGAFCALLIVVQYAFSAIKGVELVTLFFVTFSFAFGGVYGVLVALSYSLLRCLIYGFFPNVVILYLAYYPALALAAGALGKRLRDRSKIKRLVLVTIFAIIATVCFSLLDCVVTPLFYSYAPKAWLAYAYQTVPVCLIQCVSSLISFALLFLPLEKTFNSIAKRAE